MKLKLLLLLLFTAGSAAGLGAQNLPPQDDTQVWPELTFTSPISKHFDFYTSLSARLGKNSTRLNDGRYGIGFVWKPLKPLSIQPLFFYIRSRNSAGRFRTENRLNLRVSYRLPIKQFGLSHRSSIEYRARRPVSSWRYRPSLTFEKDLPKEWLAGSKFFVTEEVFYDSLLKRWSRNRFSIGINKTLNKHLSVDLYYMRQNDGFTRPGDLHVIGTAWKTRF